MGNCNFAEVVTSELIKINKTISFMESCTSGLLASMFTDTEGASAVFSGSFVTYSNDIKISCGVNKDIIEKYGVYSKECAADMARAVKQYFNTDIAIGITGNTGNVDPNNPEGVSGTAYYCIIIDNDIFDYYIEKDVCNMSRNEIKCFYAKTVYETLSKLLIYE